MIQSVGKTVPVLMIILLSVTLWSFAGFLLFRDFHTEEENRFNDPVESFLSCLHVYASRAFSILLMDFLYAESSWTPFFFCTLTIVADMLCASFLISLGTRGYNQYATALYGRKLEKRRKAATEIHRLLAVNGHLDLSTWLKLCRFLPRYTVLDQHAADLFLFQCADSNAVGDALDCSGFFRLLALTSADVILLKKDAIGKTIPDTDAVSPDVTNTDISGQEAILNPINPQKGASNSDERSVTIINSNLQGMGNSLQVTDTASGSYRSFCFWLLHYSCVVTDSIRFKPFKVYSYTLRALLILQLVMLTGSATNRRAWVVFAWILQSLFWVEMVVEMIAVSRKIYLASATRRAEFFINTASVILLCCGGADDIKSPSGVLLILVLLCRFIWVYNLVPHHEIYASLLPLLLHVAFLIFAIIYFFSGFAYLRFCNALEFENADGSDDDSASWARYENLLNFHSFGQTFHTLFQVSILGSWAMVMSTAAKEAPWAAYIFFYAFRLMMTLTVYPLLFSFIIQSFALREGVRESDEQAVVALTAAAATSNLAGVPNSSSAKTSDSSGDVELKCVSGTEKSIIADLAPEELALLQNEVTYFIRDIDVNGYTPIDTSNKQADGIEMYFEDTYLSHESIFACKMHPERFLAPREPKLSDATQNSSVIGCSRSTHFLDSSVLHITKMKNSDRDNSGMKLWIRPMNKKNVGLQNALRREEILKNKLEMALFYLKQLSGNKENNGPAATHFLNVLPAR